MNNKSNTNLISLAKRGRILFVLLSFVLLIIILIGGIIINRNNTKKLQLGVQNELKSIANIKIDQISQWYEDEIYDAKSISQEYALIKTIYTWINNGSDIDKKVLDETILSLKNEHGYFNIELLSPDYKLLVSVNGSDFDDNEKLKECAKEAFSNKKTVSTGLIHSKQNDKILLNIVSPIFSENGELLSFIVFIINPEDFLFPFIQKWPIPSNSAETLILRRGDDSIEFLNNLRHVEGAALNLKIPLSRTDVPGVQVALGYVGIFEGLDYRDVKVLTYLDKIPGTPWYIVSKVDKNEIYSNVNKQSDISLIVLLLILGIVFLFSAFIFTQYQKNTYKSLYLSQEEFKTTLYSIGDGVITTDKYGLIKNINNVAEQLTGWKEIEAINKPIQDVFKIINEISLAEVESPVQKVIEKGKIVGLANHTLLISKDGKHIPIADSGAPIFSNENEIIGVVLVFRDQTEERNHNNIVEENRRQLSTLLSNLSGMAYRCKNDSKRTLEFVSKGCLQLTGYNDNELIGDRHISFGNLIVEDDQKYVWDEVQKALNNKTNFEIEYRIRTKNNSIIWIWEKGQGVYEEHGDLIAVEGFIHDINERKNIESALKESKQLFQNLALNATVGIFRTNSSGLTTYVNPEWCKITGLQPEEAMGDKWISHVHPDDINALIENWNASINGNKGSAAEYRFIGKNNEVVWVNGQAVPEYDENHELLGYIGTISNVTETKLLLDSLTEKEKGFNAAQELAKVGSWEYDLASKTVSWSKQMFRQFNLDFSEDPPQSDEYLKFVHPDDHELVRTYLDNIEKGDLPDNLEFRTDPNLVPLKYLISSIKIEKNSDGEIIKISGTITDVTKIKESELKLEYSNLLLRTFIDNVPDAIYLKDIEGKKLIANKADLINCGLENEKDVIGKSDFDIFPKKKAQEFWLVDQKVINEGQEILNVEEEIVISKNESKWLSTSKIPFRDSEGNIIGLVGIGRDITRIKKGEDEKLKLLTVLTQSPVSIIITNIEGNIEYANPKFTEVSGYSFDEIKGKNPRILKSGTQTAEYYNEMWDNLRNGKEWRGEFQNKKKSGELFWENEIIATIKNNNGEIVNYVAIKEDITSKRQLMSDLLDAKERAEDSDRLKSSFLANMSHEIRTPLNSILGFTSLVTESGDLLNSDEKEEYTSIIKNSGDSLLQIINDIIDISSLETGQLKIVNSAFDSAEVIHSLYTEFSRKVKEKGGLELRIIENENPAKIKTDRNRLNQIFINLLTNALKFTEKGYIEFGIESTDQRFVNFMVRDTGMGIEKELQKVIFERFRQVEHTNTRHIGGNGLGLSIVKNLIELMGGQISVESKLGKGSVFRFSLPIEPIKKENTVHI